MKLHTKPDVIVASNNLFHGVDVRSYSTVLATGETTAFNLSFLTPSLF